MLTSKQINEHLSHISYKDGWKFEVHESEWEGPFIRILVDVPDTYNEGETTTLGINTFIPPTKDTEEFERWLLARVIRIESHEAREFFKRDGEVIFDPHAEGEPFRI